MEGCAQMRFRGSVPRPVTQLIRETYGRRRGGIENLPAATLFSLPWIAVQRLTSDASVAETHRIPTGGKFSSRVCQTSACMCIGPLGPLHSRVFTFALWCEPQIVVNVRAASHFGWWRELLDGIIGSAVGVGHCLSATRWRCAGWKWRSFILDLKRS